MLRPYYNPRPWGRYGLGLLNRLMLSARLSQESVSFVDDKDSHSYRHDGSHIGTAY